MLPLVDTVWVTLRIYYFDIFKYWCLGMIGVAQQEYPKKKKNKYNEQRKLYLKKCLEQGCKLKKEKKKKIKQTWEKEHSAMYNWIYVGLKFYDPEIDLALNWTSVWQK